jgi:CHAD domain-containing protein
VPKTTVSSGRSGTRSLRRVARRYLDRAEKSLAGDPPSSRAVHAARKSLKKARTGLRLLRPTLAASIYRRENVALRDAAHSLNEARDASVLLQTLQSLRSHESSLRSSTTLAELARELQSSRSRAEARLHSRPVLDSLRQALKQAERRARDWPVGRHGWTVLGPALRRIYRSGRRCTPSARSLPPDEALHEWRKQVKYLRYALRMLKPMAPGPLGALERRAHDLSDHLGQEHDFALLAGHALAFGAAHSGHDRDQGLRALIRIIEERRRRLTSQALMEGELLYQERPRELQRRFARDWRHWRNSNS